MLGVIRNRLRPESYSTNLCPLVSGEQRSSKKENKFGTKFQKGKENNNAAIKLRTIGLFYKTTSSIHCSVVNLA